MLPVSGCSDVAHEHQTCSGGVSAGSITAIATARRRRRNRGRPGPTTSMGAVANDGRWQVRPAAAAPYRTRIVSFVPDASKFNGTVIVEWLNVTAGFDLANDLAYMSPEIERSGYAWVGVSAQKVGVSSLRTTDPARYGTLDHLGDAFALDIFSQVGRAVRDGDLAPIDALKTATVARRRSVAIGVRADDLHQRDPTDCARLRRLLRAQSRRRRVPTRRGQRANSFSTGAIRIRTDIDVPILVFETETDEQIGRLLQRPPARHAAHPAVGHRRRFTRGLLPCALREHGRMHRPGQRSTDPPRRRSCAAHARSVGAAGKPPPTAPRLVVKTVAEAPTVQRERHGIAEGEIRTPAVDVPVAAYSGIVTDHSTTVCEPFRRSRGPR